MKERRIDFSVPSNNTIVKDPNGKLDEMLQKMGSDVNEVIGLTTYLLKGGQLTESSKNSALFVIESNVGDFLTKMGYESVLAAEQEKRYEEIRSLTDENKLLRQQLGEKVSNEDVRERLKMMASSFEDWWSEHGFGHVSNFYFGTNYAEIKLSGMVFPFKEEGDKTDTSNKTTKQEYLSNLGFDVEHLRVFYNEKSIALLRKLLTDKYPSIEIRTIDLNIFGPNDPPYIGDIAVFLHDFNDLF